MNNAPEIIGKKKPMTQKQVEAYIQIANQKKERWFEMRFIDEEMNKDPTAMALMKVISDAIYKDAISAEFDENISQSEVEAKGVNNGSH